MDFFKLLEKGKFNFTSEIDKKKAIEIIKRLPQNNITDIIYKTKGETLLMILSQIANSEDVMKEVLTLGADINFRNYGKRKQPGPTAIMLAISKGLIGNIKFLKENGANMDNNVLRWAATTSLPNTLEIFEYVVKNMSLSSIDSKDDNGSTVLSRLIQNNKKEGISKFVHVLLENGADPNIVNYFRKSPFQEACYRGYKEIVEDIIVHGWNGIAPIDEAKTCLETLGINLQDLQRKRQLAQMKKIDRRVKRLAEEGLENETKKVKTGSLCEIFQQKCNTDPLLVGDWCDESIPQENLYQLMDYKECYDIQEILTSMESGLNMTQSYQVHNQVFQTQTPQYPLNPYNRRPFTLYEIVKIVEYGTFVAKVDMLKFPTLIKFLELLANNVLDCKKYNGKSFSVLGENGSYVLTDEGIEFKKIMFPR
jgi:hypothetical protein